MNAACVLHADQVKAAIDRDMSADVPDDVEVQIASSAALRTGDARRLTGPGLMWDRAGAVLEAEFTDFKPDRVAALWRHHARRVLDAVGWSGEDCTERHSDGGIAVAISAPVDQLYSATSVLQTAWHFVAADLLEAERGDFKAMIGDLRGEMAREADPALVALTDAARARGLEVLADEDTLSFGHGKRSKSFVISTLPGPETVDWDGISNLPLGLITGTNGKTTTTRLAVAMATEAGQVAGLTSSDMVRVGGTVLEQGDFSGPGGARMLLRDGRLEIGFLELARGGILRRGLPVRQAKAAVVTNVAADHLGEYGITTVAQLAEVKFAIRRGLGPGGVLILNADDAPVVAEAAQQGLAACWFSRDAQAPQIVAARTADQRCGFVEEGAIWLSGGKGLHRVIAVADMPIAMGGAAGYNISNALAAACLCDVLGVDRAAIGRALAAFRSDPFDNPGRCNEFPHNGARVFVDFAHNPHSIAAVTGVLGGLAANRRFVMIAHAGDRSDQDIRDLAQGACALRPDFVVITELPGYLRGRSPGEIPGLLRDEVLAQGMTATQILYADTPADGAAKVMGLLQPGDLALLLVHADRDAIFKMLGA